MSHLKKICEEILVASEKATDRPWERSFLYEVYPGAASKKEQNRNAEYIILSANAAPKLARALLIMSEAFTEILSKNPNAVSQSEAADMSVEFHMIAHSATCKVEALQKAEEILK